MAVQGFRKNLFSFSASGSIGKTVTYGKWGTIAYSKSHPKPKQPHTRSQQVQQSRMRAAKCYLNHLSNIDRAAWYATAAEERNGLCGSLTAVKYMTTSNCGAWQQLGAYRVRHTPARYNFDVSARILQLWNCVDKQDALDLRLHTYEQRGRILSDSAMSYSNGWVHATAPWGVTRHMYYRIYDQQCSQYISGTYKANK